MRAEMKVASGLLVTVVLLASCGGGDKGTGPGGGEIPPPVSTPVGAPIGAPATATITASGGTLTTPDGAVSITIDNGALLTDTEIGIQMITAQAPSGTSKTFRLTPDGVTFAIPAQVTITYNNLDVFGSLPELLTIGTQLANGTWQILDDEDVEVNQLANTITFSIPHFSDYTMLQGLQIRPAFAEIEENANILVSVKNCTTVADLSTENQSAYAYDCVEPNPVYQSMTDDDLPPLPTFRLDPSTWAANGLEGGDPTEGFVEGNHKEAQYTAPAQAPPGNPVAVSVHVLDRQGHDLQLVSHIKIKTTCGGNLRGAAGLRDLCDPPNLFGTSHTTITDATPLYRMEADIEWVYDLARSVPGQVATFFPRGSARFIPLDGCTAISPDTHHWDLTYEHSTGSITVSTIGSDSMWTGLGGVLWTATYTDTCDPNEQPTEGAVGGAYFAGNGDFTGSLVFQGTQSIGGQTFTYSFAAPTTTARRPALRTK